MSILQLHQLSKSFDGVPAVNNISLSLNKGQILCLLGPSGCGKTTLLRLIAGLDRPDTGSVFFAGRNISNVPPHQRDFGLMFQDFALFPHKNVAQNVAFGLQMKQEAHIESQVKRMLDRVGMAGFEDRDISNLSGGERQRVALARSLAPNPRLLMLDEPLGALDRALRERLMLEIRQILKSVGLTAVYVTHDQTEAFAVSDRILVMHNGQVEQDATPEHLYHQPATARVARFLGFKNLLGGVCLANGRVDTPLGQWTLNSPDHHETGQSVTVLVRPEAASLQPLPAHTLALNGTVQGCLFRGRFYQITIVASGCRLTFEMQSGQIPLSGEKIELWLNPAAILLLPVDGNGGNKMPA